ncbi:MAG: response regulator [Myxococcaceae bacterium]
MSDEGPKILGVDEQKARQASIAASLNQAGFFYRFISEKKKLTQAVKQLSPQLIILYDEPGSMLVSEALDLLAQDVATATVPIALMCQDQTEQPFVNGLRTGVVTFLSLPFDPRMHPAELKLLLGDLTTRRGMSSGHLDTVGLSRLAEHMRRTKRSGKLTIQATGAPVGEVTFALGRVESARFGKHSGVEALVLMVAQKTGDWSFSEVGGGDGAGVVIEFGEDSGGATEEEISVVIGTALEEAPSQPFEMGLVAPAIAPVTAAAPPARASKLLLVDDDEALCRMFSTLFTKHGFTVTIKEDGVEGFAAAQVAPYDAVIADLNMPRLDGWGMLKLLREDVRTRELPIAFLSCHDDYREKLRATNAGAQAYFSKGGRLDALVGQVRKLLEPRALVAQLIDSKKNSPVSVGTVGPQWLAEMLAERRFSGRLDAKDNFAEYRLFFEEGRPVHATAAAGRFTAEGERAFNAFIASRGAEGALNFGTHPAPPSLQLPLADLLARARELLNDNERRAREGMMVGANEIQVDPDLYHVYQMVGPKQSLEVARLICEERVPPREVIARVELSPVEIEETLKDLVRRGVVTLRK